MESALVSIVSVALVIIASVTMMLSSFTSINSMMDSWMKMEEEAEEIRRTDIALDPPDGYNGGSLVIYAENEGDANIISFDDWDVIFRFENGDIRYINYTDSGSPESNEWTLNGIYLTEDTAVAEKFDHNILNPGESARLEINLDPELDPGQYGMVVVSTENGVTSQCFVQRQ